MWTRSVLAYTLAGLVAAALTGAFLAWVATLVPTGASGNWVTGWMLAVPILSVVLAAREIGWVRYPLPQCSRQTEKIWAQQFGPTTAAAMWGAHIGLGFATRVNHGGFWVLVAAILALSDVAYGAALMSSYWLGRAFSIVVAPLTRSSLGEAFSIARHARESRPIMMRYHALGLLCTAAIGVGLFLSNGYR